ncbi:helix-hairpin-helix domain-containing protein, partial [Coxiella endosymbiont of Rhipicephalus microplus]|uniref:helix-hairpin-helix domain-containing protein n=1 Tax=Coxiella endosymbiont of Rhipicephalus microplus TaxID=1656186 RepID=UPI001F3416DA
MIPEIVAPLLEKRLPNAKVIKMPARCPICQSEVIKPAGEAVARCMGGLYCQAQLRETIKHFVSRRAMNIKGLGEKLVTLFINKKLIRDITDIYKLDKTVLLALPRISEQSAKNLLTAIEKSKTTTLTRFLYALGIRGVGETTVRTLVWHFQELEPLMQASNKDLLDIKDIGPITVANIRSFFQQKYNVELINKLIHLGIQWSKEKVTLKLGISGKAFVLSGSLNTLTRKEAKEKIEHLGGKTSSRISKNTDYLVCGKNYGSK